MMEDGDEAVFGTIDPFRVCERGINTGLTKAVGLMALRAVGRVEALSKNPWLGRRCGTRGRGVPVYVTGIKNIPTETTAIEEEIIAHPESGNECRAKEPTGYGCVIFGWGSRKLRRIVFVHLSVSECPLSGFIKHEEKNFGGHNNFPGSH